MAFQAIGDLLNRFDIDAKPSNVWEQIIGDRTAESMKTETACKFHLDKKSTNAYKRLMHLQTLFAQISPKSSTTEEKTDDNEAHHDCECHHDHAAHDNPDIFKPIDNILEVARGESVKADKASAVYTISSQDDLSVDCNFSFIGGDKWYYEVELLEDPTSYKDINIGFANADHSARSEVGHDGDSYGYNGVKNKLFNIKTDYGKQRWKEGDILGFALDLNDDGNSAIEFYLNGESQGIAFEGVDYKDYLLAGFTLQRGQHAVFIYDEAKLKQKKPANYTCIPMNNDMKQEDLWEIDGEIKVESVEDGIKLTSNAGFPTALLKGVQFTKGNKYYYELELGTGGCMQLGYGDSEFKPNSARGEGIGDDNHSWGCDFLRMRKWGMFGTSYCNANWTKGDIIGCVLDLDLKQIRYTLNGKDLGIAFEEINTSQGLYPAVSVRNTAAREKSMAYYQQKRTAANPEELIAPERTNYFNLIFSDEAYKYKANGCNAMTKHVAFQAMEICNSLQQYSYNQYKEDYAFMDTVIMLQKDEEFDEIMKRLAKDTLVVIDFWASWCGPCIYIAPHYHHISEQFPNVVFLKADVDKLTKLSKEKAIKCMPTFKFFKNGEEVHKIEGADKDAIVEAVKKYSQ